MKRWPGGQPGNKNRATLVCKNGHVNPPRTAKRECKRCRAASRKTPEYKAWQRAYFRKYRQANRARLNAYSRAYAKTAKGRLLSRRGNWRAYGIDIREAETRLLKHNGRCEICGTDNPGGAGGWHVDHDHKTKRVRGVLCYNCNRGIGHLKDDVVVLRRAVKYLERTK